MLTNYKTIITYAGIEATICQILIICHQLTLYAHLDSLFFGFIGMLFSIVYLGVTILNSGFDQTIAAHFHQARTNRSSFRSLIGIHMLANLCIWFGCLCMSYFILPHIMPAVSTSTALLLGLCMIIETYRKSSKNILYLLLKYHGAAWSEILHTIIYISTVWALLMLHTTPSIELFFLPLIGISLIQSIIHTFYILHYYITLSSVISTETIDWHALLTERIGNFAYQLTHLLYSANFLIPLFAHTDGMEFAGILKLVSMGAYGINSIIRHTFGTSCIGLFSYYRQATTQCKHKAFSHLNRYLEHVYVGLLFLIVSVCYVMHTTDLYPLYTILTTGIFLFLIFSDHLIITHEQFMLTEGKSWYLCFFSISALIPMIAVYAHSITSGMAILSLLTLSKYLRHSITLYYTHTSWQLPSLFVRTHG